MNRQPLQLRQIVALNIPKLVPEMMSLGTASKMNVFPSEKGSFQTERLVFQASFLRGYVSLEEEYLMGFSIWLYIVKGVGSSMWVKGTL